MSNCTTYSRKHVTLLLEQSTKPLFSWSFTSHGFEPLIITRKLLLIIKSLSSQGSFGISHGRILLFKSALTWLNQHAGQLAELWVMLELAVIPQVSVNVVIYFIALISFSLQKIQIKEINGVISSYLYICISISKHKDLWNSSY